MKKRLFLLILSFCVILAQLPTAFAAQRHSMLHETALEPPVNDGVVREQMPLASLEDDASVSDPGEDIPVPGPAQARYRTEADGEWVTGSLADAVANVYEGGRVEVLEDVVLEEPLTINKPLTLTSAEAETPRTIRYTTSTRGDFGVTVYADVRFENIILDGGREEGLATCTELVGVQRNATLTLGAGAVIQNNDNVDTAEAAGGLRVVGSHVIMEEGAVIRNCRGVAGGGAAVTTNGILELNGGVIENCQAFVGGGIYLPQKGGDVKIYAGAIRGNQARKNLEGMSYKFSMPKGCGGGIAVNQGRVYLLGGGEGGALEENYAESGGGGIYVSNGLLQLANGSVTGNEAGGYGGGVCASPYTYIAVGNTPVVTDNTGGNRDEGRFDNLYLDGAEDYGGPATRPMTVGAALGDGTVIGVARWLRPDEDHPYRVVAVPNAGKYTITASDLDKFYSDDPAYITLLHDGDIVLATADVIFDTQGHGVAPKGQNLAEDRKAGEPDAPCELGYDFGGWYKEAACETPWDFENDVILETRAEPLTLYAKWTPTPYAITYELDGGENAAGNPAGYTIESETVTLASPEKEGHTFLGWTEGDGETPSISQTIPQGSTGDKIYTAQWAVNTYPVTFDIQGHGTAPEAQTVRWGGKAAVPEKPTESGWQFGGWYKEAACETAWDFEAETVTEAVTLYAKWTRKTISRPSIPKPPEEQEIGDTPVPVAPYPELEREEHFAYIVGYPDGSVRPEGYITRAEAVTVFFRLMTEDSRTAHWSDEDIFPDADAEKWYHNAVSTAARAGLVSGLPGGLFGGEREVTRAEFAVVAARFLSEEDAPDSGFADLTGHWAKAEVDRAVAAGWIKGCDDGLFHPDDLITRAQVMALVNRMLGRVPNPEGMHPEMRLWPDNGTDAWYYGDVQEATNSHRYDRTDPDGPETWTGLEASRDWTALER